MRNVALCHIHIGLSEILVVASTDDTCAHGIAAPCHGEGRGHGHGKRYCGLGGSRIGVTLHVYVHRVGVTLPVVGVQTYRQLHLLIAHLGHVYVYGQLAQHLVALLYAHLAGGFHAFLKS